MKWVLWAFVVLVGVLILITLIGYLLPKEHTVTREARFQQSPEVIWKTITDIDGMPAWRQSLKSVKRLPDRNGLPAWVETLDSGTIPLETITSQPPSKLVVRIADPKLPFGGTWTYEITPLPSGSNLRIREDGEVYNPLFRSDALRLRVYGHDRRLSEIHGEEIRRTTTGGELSDGERSELQGAVWCAAIGRDGLARNE